MSLATGLIPIDEVVHFDICTHDPSTGGVSDADSTPTFSVFEEATDTAILAAQNFTKRTSLTGDYRGTFTASLANGFEAGKWYSVIATAVVGGVTGKKNCGSFRCAPAESTAGVPVSDPQAATVRSAVGLASANIDTQLSAIAGYVDTEIGTLQTTAAAIKAKTDNLPASPAAVSDIPTSAVIADAVWDEAQAGHTTPGTFGANLDASVSGVSTGGVSAAAIADAVCDELLAGHTTAGSVGKALSDVLAAVDTEIAAIKAKTDNLPVDPADASDIAASFTSIASTLSTIAGYIDTEVAAIKAKTDKLTFDASNNVSGNVKAINDTSLTGNGTSLTPWGPA